MKIFRILLLFIALISFSAKSQTYCSVVPNFTDSTICPGDSVLISVVANLVDGNMAFDFNSGTIPSGWNTGGASSFSSPCLPSPDNTPYFWASTSTTGNPSISTAAFDVSCGGYIIFNMVYAVQGGSVPCEGPDEADEGVSLMYSNDNGLTWTTITYFSPGGYQLPANPFTSGGVLPPGNITPYTSWGTYTIPIPPGAMTSNTMFQWIQESPTSGTCCDNWGIENIIINAGGPPCGSGAVVNWSNGLTDTTSFWAVPATDTFFVATVFDTLGNQWCESDTIFVNLSDGNYNYTLQDQLTIYCPDDSAQASVLNVTGAVLPMSYLWSNGDTTNSSYLNGMGSTPDSIFYYVEIFDACGSSDYDSVMLIVNQTLDVTGFTTLSQINCSPSGGASATVTGNQGTMSYYWTGPGNSGTYTSNQLSINGVTTGWYYFTVTDNVCSTTDSVFIDSLFIDNVTYTLPDTLMVFCPDDSIAVNVAVSGATQPVTYAWSNGDTTSSTILDGSSLEHDTLEYYISFTDACGVVREDTVVLITNKTLNIDSLIMDPTTTCQPDGMAQAFVSGQTAPTTYMWENEMNWDQAGSGDSLMFQLTWNNIGSGWYYFTVTDSECQDIDSIEVTMLEPPMAVIVATPDYGCAPLTVTVENNSLNTGYYVWDFGNGNTLNTTSTIDQLQVYTNSGTITLNAYIDATQNCGDQASITITIPECGCTDPIADNYNALAVVDDGSCTYPLPVVYPPNVFTPNGDGKNDYLYFESINAIDLEILITNRWGNVMYSVNYDPSTINTSFGAGVGYSWDGRTPGGADAEEGTYFYKYRAIGVNGDETTGHGFVQLSRN